MHRMPRKPYWWKVDSCGLSATSNQPRVLPDVGPPKGPIVDFRLAACYVGCMKQFTYHVECTGLCTVERITIQASNEEDALQKLTAATLNGEHLTNPRLERVEERN